MSSVYGTTYTISHTLNDIKVRFQKADNELHAVKIKMNRPGCESKPRSSGTESCTTEKRKTIGSQ